MTFGTFNRNKPLPRVLVVYPFLHHYRHGAFSEMDASTNFEYVFAASPHGRDGIETMEFSSLKRVVHLRNCWRGSVLYQRGLASHILTHEYDAVIFLADPRYISTWIAALLTRARRRPVLFWTIGFHRPEAGVKRLVRKLFFALSTRLLFYGEVAKSIAVELGYDASKIDVIRNSQVDTPRSGQAEDFAVPEVTGITIGAVVRLSASKNLSLVVRAAAILRSRGLSINVMFVGDGPERDSLDHLAKTLNVPLYMPGAAYHPDTLKAVYQALDITVLPTNAGLSVMQSFRHGTPVISGDDPFQQVPEWEAIRPGLTGDYFKTGDATALADSIVRLRESLLSDPDAVAQACIRTVDVEWSPEFQVRALEQGIAKVIKLEH